MQEHNVEIKPLVSIVIACYNDPDNIEKAIMSALNQSYSNKEVIVVDDGSNAETKTILKKLESKITKLITQENQGQSVARNNGIKNAIGVYILNHDSDDFFEPSYCEKAVVKFQEDDKITIVTCQANRFDETGFIDVFTPVGGNLNNFLFANSALGSSMFKRIDWEISGGYEEKLPILGFEDWEFYIQILKSGGYAYVIKEVLFNYQVRVNSTTYCIRDFRFDKFRHIIMKHEVLYKDNFENLVEDLFGRIQREEVEKIKNTKRLEFLIGDFVLKPLRKIKKKLILLKNVFYILRKKIKRVVIVNFNYYKILLQGFYTKPKVRTVYIDITEIDENRYLYNLIKFFKLDGYTIYLPKNKRLINELCKNKGEFKYASLILNGDFKIGIPKIKKGAFFIHKENLSNDYFNDEFKLKPENYHVPMSQYPLMYDCLDVEKDIDFLSKRKRSVFMAGNFDPMLYSDISRNGFFEILSRKDIVEFVYKQSYYHQLNSFEGLIKFIEKELDFKVILIDRAKDFLLELDDLKKVLKKFDFFMALPGILIPQSHNLIEAMAMGCIPIIHRTYADLFYPPLQHYQTAIVYESKEELDVIIRTVFELNEQDVFSLRKNVLMYYNTYLTPKAVVDTIINNNFSKIIIQAEYISLNIEKHRIVLHQT
jgi:glycosyltransferase involved in cell wall biosynthesis